METKPSAGGRGWNFAKMQIKQSNNREPTLCVEEFAKECGVNNYSMGDLLKADGAPQPVIAGIGSRNRRYFRASELRKWWKDRSVVL